MTESNDEVEEWEIEEYLNTPPGEEKEILS